MMSQSTVDLGKHGQATLRDPEDVPERLRRAVQRAHFAIEAFNAELKDRGEIPADVADEDIDDALKEKVGMLLMLEQPQLMENLDDALIVALVEVWPFSLAVTVGGVGELPGGAYDRLRQACRELGPTVLPNYTEITAPEEGNNTPFGS